MRTAERAREVVLSAEKRLRDLVGVAASEGDYDLAQSVAGWAKLLGEIVADSPIGARNSSVGASAIPSKPDADQARRPSPNRPSRRPSKKDYPRFFRSGDQLVKIGWSKKDRREYAHRAPRSVVDALATAVGQHGSNGKLFTSEDVLPLNDPGSGEEAPSYQVYVGLAWLKQEGLIDQQGRSGYRSKARGRLADAISNAWEKLGEPPL
jgi:hypothetical protein